jgi:hypothetical protein
MGAFTTWKFMLLLHKSDSLGVISGILYAGLSLHAPIAVTLSRPASEPVVIARAVGPIRLKEGPVKVVMIEVGGHHADGRSLADRVLGLEKNQQLYLIIRDLSVTAQPGVLYDVYFDLISVTAFTQNDVHYIGTINFFNAVSSSTPSPARNSPFLSFDITDTLKKLQSSYGLTEPSTVTFIPSGQPFAESRPIVGQIDLVEVP